MNSEQFKQRYCNGFSSSPPKKKSNKPLVKELLISTLTDPLIGIVKLTVNENNFDGFDMPTELIINNVTYVRQKRRFNEQS